MKGQLGQFLHEVKVTREYPVASGAGFELSGSLGDSVVAWDGTVLKASVLAGTRFNPPVAILDGAKKETKIPWKGRMYMAGKTLEGSGSLDQREGVWSADQRLKAIQTDLVLQLGDRTLKVTTIYVRGKGPVSQKQWTITGINETYDFGFEWLGGP